MASAGDSMNVNGEETSTNPLSALSTNENNLSLVVLMGLPASGKTTLANKLSNLCTRFRTIKISFDDYAPLNIQVKIAKLSQNSSNTGASASDEPIVGFNSTSLHIGAAKSIRKKFVHCVDAVVKFSKELGSRKVCQTVDQYLESLRSSLSAYESNDLVSDASFLLKIENVMKTISDFYAKNRHCLLGIIVDDNNYYHSMRNEFYQVAKPLEIGFSMIYCKTPVKTCMRRNLERPAELQVPCEAIVEMALKFEEPNPLQNACDAYCVQIDMNADHTQINLQLLEEIMANSICHPLEKTPDRGDEIQRERRICSDNEVHQADLVLRKWINKQLNIAAFSNSFKMTNDSSAFGNAGNAKKIKSKELNAKKKVALEKLRTGELKVSFLPDQDVEFQREIVKLFENLEMK